MGKFITVLIGLAACVVGAAWLTEQHGLIRQRPSFFYQSLLFIILITAIIYRQVTRPGRKLYFVQVFLLSLVIKLLASLCFITFVVLKDKEGAAANVTFFLVIYVLFTIVEVAFLHRKISSEKGP